MDTIDTSTAVARLRGMDGTPHDSRYGGFFGEVADLIEAMQAEHDAALARVAELEGALIWCSGSADFNEGGIAREGWQNICAHLLFTMADPAASIAAALSKEAGE